MQEHERLLGYLMNALDVRETAQVERDLLRQPFLRSELAMLQRQISPLDYMSDPVEPPPLLASKTCAKIWAVVDKEERPNTFLDSTFDSAVPLPAVRITKDDIVMKTSQPAESETTKIVTQNNGGMKTSHWIGMVASVSVGIIIAFFLFPMIRYAKRSTQTYITQTQMSEINQRVDRYEQIHGNKNDEMESGESLPFNFAVTGWQELPPNAITSLEPQPVSSRTAPLTEVIIPASKTPQTGGVILGQEHRLPFEPDGYDIPLSLDAGGGADQMLLSIPGTKNPVRSAFGQNILLKDGRIFFRVLPSADTPQ